jgi:hypothetical protein
VLGVVIAHLVGATGIGIYFGIAAGVTIGVALGDESLLPKGGIGPQLGRGTLRGSTSSGRNRLSRL